MLVTTAACACATNRGYASATPLAREATQPHTDNAGKSSTAPRVPDTPPEATQPRGNVAPQPSTAARASDQPPGNPPSRNQRMAISNPAVAAHRFLAEMYADDYFPTAQVDKGKAILLRLCERIEREHPKDTAALYVLTHAATEEFNRLSEDFDAHGSELETAAREAIAADFAWIAQAYGFEADIEELIAPRDW